MTRSRIASGLASFGAGLTFLTGGMHLSAYNTVVSQATTPDLRTLLAALWVSTGVALFVAALVAVAASPLFVVRRRAFLWLAALVPISMAACQIAFMGFIAPTALLLLDGFVLVVAGELGRTAQARPVPIPMPAA